MKGLLFHFEYGVCPFVTAVYVLSDSQYSHFFSLGLLDGLFIITFSLLTKPALVPTKHFAQMTIPPYSCHRMLETNAQGSFILNGQVLILPRMKHCFLCTTCLVSPFIIAIAYLPACVAFPAILLSFMQPIPEIADFNLSW